jgi:hypothetical protein
MFLKLSTLYQQDNLSDGIFYVRQLVGLFPPTNEAKDIYLATSSIEKLNNFDFYHRHLKPHDIKPVNLRNLKIKQGKLFDA